MAPPPSGNVGNQDIASPPFIASKGRHGAHPVDVSNAIASAAPQQSRTNRFELQPPINLPLQNAKVKKVLVHFHLIHLVENRSSVLRDPGCDLFATRDLQQPMPRTLTDTMRYPQFLTNKPTTLS
tara:strand:- start:26 stop:400 length:375 start_codon:yes stop_codon:yes gene_type:complete